MAMEKIGCEVMKAMESELERGREFAKQLRQVMLFESNNTNTIDRVDEDVSCAEDLVANVVASFTNSLSLFNTHPHPQPSLHLSHPSKSQESQKSSKTTKHRRGCYKRRKSSNTWEKVTEMRPEVDGHSWRKYGQKLILNSKFPRNYFRCTHKFDQGCQAIKQVQKIQEHPPLYKTTYYGLHACSNLLDPQLIWDSHHNDLHLSNPNSFILSFHNHNDNHISPHSNHPPFLSSSSPPPSSFLNISIKKEDQNNNNNNNNNDNPSFLYNDDNVLLSSDELTFGYSDDRDVISSGVFYDGDHGLDALVFDPFGF